MLPQNTISVSLTEIAAVKLKERLEKHIGNIGVKISVKQTGCSGLAYVLDYVYDIADVSNDMLFESRNIKIWIDHNSSSYIGDLVLDWLKTGLNESLSFSNSLEQSRCGCGESFKI